MSYVVTAQMIHVKVPAKWSVGNRPLVQFAMLTKGQTVPAEVDAEQVTRLVAAGMVAKKLPPGVEPPVA